MFDSCVIVDCVSQTAHNSEHFLATYDGSMRVPDNTMYLVSIPKQRNKLCMNPMKNSGDLLEAEPFETWDGSVHGATL